MRMENVSNLVPRSGYEISMFLSANRPCSRWISSVQRNCDAASVGK